MIDNPDSSQQRTCRNNTNRFSQKLFVLTRLTLERIVTGLVGLFRQLFQGKSRKQSRRRPLALAAVGGGRHFEWLEKRQLLAAFTAGDLAVIVAASASANNTTASVVELSTTTANQTAIQTISIPGTGSNAIRVSGSATSTLYALHTSDGSLFTLMGANSTNTSSNANTLNPRAVVTINNPGTVSIATTYTGGSGNQTRSATSLDDSSWYIADQGGVYTNNSSSASPSANVRGIKPFGGTVYVGQQSSTTGTDIVPQSTLRPAVRSRIYLA